MHHRPATLESRPSCYVGRAYRGLRSDSLQIDQCIVHSYAPYALITLSSAPLHAHIFFPGLSWYLPVADNADTPRVTSRQGAGPF